MTASSVIPLLRVVANGRAKNGTLRLTVIATPFQSNGADSFDIKDWPKVMAQRLRDGKAPFPNGQLTLWVRQIGETVPRAVGQSDWMTVQIKPSNPNAFKDGWVEVQKLWLATLGDSKAGWDDLAGDIAKSMVRQKLKDKSKLDSAIVTRRLEYDGSIAIEPPDGGDGLQISSVIPIRQSDLAIEEETIRAARVLAKQYAGPFSILDDRGTEEPVVENPQNRFDKAILATQPERAYAAATYSRIVKTIGSGEAFEFPSDADLSPRPELVPPVEHVVARPVEPDEKSAADLDREKRRATQEYGVWLQRRPAYLGKRGVDGTSVPPSVPDEKDLPKAKDAALQEIRGKFSALQGDPVLSRLFCLALDFEVVGELPVQGDVHLAVGLGDAASLAIPIATAARLQANEFWPVSIFDLKPDPQLDFVDQQDGFWRLDRKRFGGSRYEIASLDVRRSVDSKTLSRDRGEAHQTGGLTILDRGRSEQIARDLALAEYNRRKLDATAASSTDGGMVVLHAEELTIGRRVDVGVGKSKDKLVWRSLMRRYVNFNLGKDDKKVEAVLDSLIEDFREGKNDKGVLEETSFQVAARLVPTPAGYEAVAEEAIFLWDGTPVSVLTDPGQRNSVHSTLPFDSVLDLPGNAPKEAIHRPPPLRFGVPYAFRLRSAFLGGGSPSFEAESAAASPPETIVGPRRFLRHDSIAAPILLLPQHLAAYRFGHMGYEALDQAIVRSWNSAPANLEALHEPDLIKGEYVEAGQRTQPTETIRVFVPPEAPVDLVTRHAKLDAADTGEVANIRRGGLRDVSYTPRRIRLQDESYPIGKDGKPEPEPSGFPVAVSTRLDALDAEGVIYPRTIVPVETSKARGVPVFEPGGVNSTGPDQVGYLPDPAIDHYCVRAKVRGSDIYLGGFRRVQLYAGTSFPNPLPLVVKIKRVASVRSAAPQAIEEICSLPKLNTIDDKGLMPAEGKKRSRVQSIEFTLFQGEDYILEVSCLPTGAELEKRFSVPETIAMQLHFAAENSAAKERLKAMCGAAVSKACVTASTDGSTGLGGHLIPVDSNRLIVAEALLDAMQTKWPIEEISAVTTLRVCHALNKPPVEAFGWVSTADMLKTIRPEKVNTVLDAPPESRKDATELGFDGEIEIDLDLVQSFQIMATAVAADGFAIDSVDRGRSMISKRSGRWPILIQGKGCEAYVKTGDVLGFTVDENGVVTLPTEPVTLIAVGNLPSTGAVGPEVALNPGTMASSKTPLLLRPDATDRKDGLVFKKLNGRRMRIALWPLFAAAICKQPLDHWIALPKEALDRTNRTRRLHIQRPHIFTDTLARELTLDLVVVSRGAPSFETEPTYRGGKEQALLRRQPLKRTDQAIRASTQIKVWMKSTKAPAAPDVRRPEPSFVFTREFEENKQEKRHRVRREARTRLYLGRGWYSSGEGERLGIVLWPPDYHRLDQRGNDKDPLDLDSNKVQVGPREMLLDEFDDRDLGPGGSYVTRWGGDPTRKDTHTQTGFFIPPRAFRDVPELRDAIDGTPDERAAKPNPHAPQFVKQAMMPIPRAASPVSEASATAAAPEKPQEYLPVSLITYQPCFDIDREEWYVDVDLLPTRASEPFVRFGLVRYQEQSILEVLKTSEPIAVQMQLLPERTVTLQIKPLASAKGGKSPGSHVTITVCGRGSLAIKELPIRDLPLQSTTANKAPWDAWIKDFQTLHKPKMRASVFFESGGANARIRVPLALPDWNVAPRAAGSALPLEIPYVGQQGDTSEWERSFELPTAIMEEFGAGQVVLYLEEVDMRMPASYREEPVTMEKMFDPNTFVTSGPRFSARVPFFEKT